MTQAGRFSDLPEYAFPRLRALLDPIAPGADPVAMSIGDPQHAFPDFVPRIIAEQAGSFNRYPPNDGTAGLRAAIADWLGLRYGAVGIDPDRHILPLNGTREGLFNTALALCPASKNGAQPAVLLPNPFYQCYAVAALAAGAEPVYVNATAQTGFLPDFASLDTVLLDRTAIVYMCSPANPQGAVADADWWTRLLTLAEKHDFTVFADECYSEIYRDAPPPGALAAAQAMGADPDRLVIFHSLSKRSNLAGLRSGFAATGPGNIAAMRQLRNYAGAPMPLPLQHAAEAAWRDEAHVADSRALYVAKFDAADRILGNMPGYMSPQAGFFLWLAVRDGEAATVKLWRECGIKVLPGAYLSRDGGLGGGAEPGADNPGAGYIRAALVASLDEVTRGLTAIRDVLSTEDMIPDPGARPTPLRGEQLT